MSFIESSSDLRELKICILNSIVYFNSQELWKPSTQIFQSVLFIWFLIMAGLLTLFTYRHWQLYYRKVWIEEVEPTGVIPLTSNAERLRQSDLSRTINNNLPGNNNDHSNSNSNTGNNISQASLQRLNIRAETGELETRMYIVGRHRLDHFQKWGTM